MMMNLKNRMVRAKALAVLSSVFLPAILSASPDGISIPIKLAADNGYAVTNAAGVLRTVNWNNKTGQSGSGSTLNVDNFGSPSPSSATVSWCSNNTGVQNNGDHSTPDKALMNSFPDSSSGTPPSGNGTTKKVSVTVTNLDSVFTDGGYDVYVYFNGTSPGGNGTRGGSFIMIPDGQDPIQWNCGFTSPDFTTGTYVQDVTPDNTEIATETPGCNYIVFSNLTASSFFVTGNGGLGVTNVQSTKVQICGVEVVAHSAGSTIPTIVSGPRSKQIFNGKTVSFTVTASGIPSPTYQWKKGATGSGTYTDIPNATNATLILPAVSATDNGDYVVKVTNPAGSITSDPATLEVVSPSDDYDAAISALNPFAYYRFNEAGDSLTGLTAYDNAGGFNGVYGDTVLNGYYGIFGPEQSDFPGFADVNGAAQFSNGDSSQIPVTPWKITTNSMTFTAWLYPTGPQSASAGIVFCRGTTTSGFNYTGSTNAEGNYTLGYTWNGDGNTFFWDSEITAPQNEWSLAALVVTPTNATVYVLNKEGILSSTHTYDHTAQTFDGTTLIGNDSFKVSNRGFNGNMDDVALFTGALSRDQLTSLFTTASGVSTFPPAIATQPVSQTLYEQQTATFTASVSGTGPLHYQWQKGTGGVYSDVTDDARISGANTATLSISNINSSDASDYILVVTNFYGSITSDAATLTVTPALPAETITMSVVESNPQDWDTAANWSDGLAASVSSVSKPGSTYHILPGAALRTPATSATAEFPGDVLYVEGNGEFTTAIAGSGIGGLLLKGANPSTIHFKKLVMAGGEILNFINSGGNAVLTGELNVVSNTPIFAADDTRARTIRIESKLTGDGNIEYHGYTGNTFKDTAVASLNIAGANNPYTGTWNVVLGTLVGSANNALGTNTITVGAQGALQTTYDINNPDGALILDGRMNLTRNDTFGRVVVGGVELPGGTYTFAQLNSAYPTNFPATWTAQPGAPETAGSGSITVLQGATAPVRIEVGKVGSNLQLNWPEGALLLEATNLSGPWTTNTTAVPPFTVTPSGPRKFFKLIVQ
ncbi:MAG TPA: immunoglobulin domain-containing protein [Verrucomicrobiae bacterium]|nr:immunoglobulin domain-containing protein [Verrucomicrobiae bacterium]